MILARLYELAQVHRMLDDPAFRTKPVACRIDIDVDGNFLGVHDRREHRTVPLRKGELGRPKGTLSRGQHLAVPVRPVQWDAKLKKWKTTDAAAGGQEKPAVFLADALARVLPIERLIPKEMRAKFESQRSTFWRFLQHAADDSNDESLRALVRFDSHIVKSPDIQEQLCIQVENAGYSISDVCTFALNEHQGPMVLEQASVQAWWRTFFSNDFQSQPEGKFRGLCQVTGDIAALSSSVKSKINGLIPIGCLADAYLVTSIASAESYNLDGAVSGMVSARAIDGITRALNALIGNQLGQSSSFREGGVMFLFWTREAADSGVMTLFDADVAQIEALLKSVREGGEYHGRATENQFYLLTLSGNSARVIVRDYLETPLPRLRRHLARWFADVRIADLHDAGQPTSVIPLREMMRATALDADHVSPNTPSRLVAAAITGGPVCDSLLVACLRRLRVEGAHGFRAPRMALIKLILLRRDVLVTETLNPDERHYAYLYGRLLAIFEQIQYAALGDVNANVVDKFYGTFSAAPALVFCRLYSNAQNHLRKLRGDKPGSYVALDKLLVEVSSLLPASPPRGQLSLQDQGRFALGYYHQRARQFEQIAERKAKHSSPDNS